MKIIKYTLLIGLFFSSLLIASESEIVLAAKKGDVMPFDAPNEPHPCPHEKSGYCEYDKDCEHKEPEDGGNFICELEL